MDYKTTHKQTIKEAWWEFHKNNPEIYDLFEKETKRAIARGRKKLSSKMIINFIRWNIYVETTTQGEEYKINDAYTPYYARLFEHYNPKYKGVFNKRRIRSN